MVTEKLKIEKLRKNRDGEVITLQPPLLASFTRAAQKLLRKLEVGEDLFQTAHATILYHVV